METFAARGARCEIDETLGEGVEHDLRDRGIGHWVRSVTVIAVIAAAAAVASPAADPPSNPAPPSLLRQALAGPLRDELRLLAGWLRLERIVVSRYRDFTRELHG